MSKNHFLIFFVIILLLLKISNQNECSLDNILKEACSKLKSEVEGKNCYYNGITCSSSYTSCSQYTGTNQEECENINLEDLKYKCLFNNETKTCFQKTKTCSEYIKGKGKEFCEKLDSEDSKTRCFYKKEEDICITQYNNCNDVDDISKCFKNVPSDTKYKCIYEESKCINVKRKCSEYLVGEENCWDLEAKTKGKSCIIEDGTCVEKYKFCEDYTGDNIDENVCETIKPYIQDKNNIDYNHKCVKEDNKCITKQKECSDYDPSKETSDYCTKITFEENNKKSCVIDKNNICKEYYTTCEDYTGNDETICRNIITYNANGNINYSLKCIIENDKCITKSLQCSEYYTIPNYETDMESFCKLIIPEDKSKQCVFQSPNQCVELPKKCEEYTGYSRNLCESITIYDNNNKEDFSHKCVYEGGSCATGLKDCSDAKNDYDCNNIILSETTRCFYYYSYCQEFYKSCEDYSYYNSLICELIEPFKSMYEIDEEYECVYEDYSCNKRKKENAIKYCNYFGTNDELCEMQKSSNFSSKVCSLDDNYNCIEKFKYCSDYNGTSSEECSSIIPYDEETNKKDPYSKCVYQYLYYSRYKCVKDTKKCNEYTGTDSTICSKYHAENANKKCVLKGNQCTEQYKTCETYTGYSLFTCEDIILDDYTKKCVYEGGKCITKERTCSEFDLGYLINYCENHSFNDYKKKCFYNQENNTCEEHNKTCEEIIFENNNEATEEKCNAINLNNGQICSLKRDKSGCRKLHNMI